MRIRLASASVLACMLPAFAAAPAAAATFLSPGDGARVPYHFTGPIVVQWAAADALSDTIEIRYEAEGSGVWLTACSFDDTTATQGGTSSCTVPPLDSGDYGFRTFDTTLATAYGPAMSLIVDRPAPVAPELSRGRVSARSFYPLVRDGYRDFVVYRWSADRAARTVITVRAGSASGRVVRRAALGVLAGGRTHAWRWNGRTRSGRRVEPGRYVIHARASIRGAAAATRWRRVLVRTGVATRRFAAEKPGTATAGAVTGCRSGRRATRLTIVCRAGQHARARYLFRLPRGALGVRADWSGRYLGGLPRVSTSCDVGGVARRPCRRSGRWTVTIRLGRSHATQAVRVARVVVVFHRHVRI